MVEVCWVVAARDIPVCRNTSLLKYQATFALAGVLITDVLTPDCLQGTFEEMAKLRRESLSEEKKILFDKLIKQKNLTQKE